MEYWAVIWGTIIMGVTGLMVWFKMDVTQWLPRWLVDVALTIHYYEAILACLAIIVWHFYHVMFDPDVYPVNLACWDGKVSQHLQAEEHPLEALTPDAEEASLHREVVEILWRGRTVEGDLGMRWSATGVADAALAEKLVAPGAGLDTLEAAARLRHDDPSWLPVTAADRGTDAEIARLALTVALRRHARPADTVDGRTPGRDLSAVRVVVARTQHLEDLVVVDRNAVDLAAVPGETRFDVALQLHDLAPEIGRDLVRSKALHEHVELTRDERVESGLRLRGAHRGERLGIGQCVGQRDVGVGPAALRLVACVGVGVPPRGIGRGLEGFQSRAARRDDGVGGHLNQVRS